MKKILLLVFVSMIISSCATIKIPYQENIYACDFSKYTSEGFIITPATTGFNYDPIAEISMEFTPGYKTGYIAPSVPATVKELNKTDDLYYNTSPLSKSSKGGWFVPDYDYMLAQFVAYVKSKGADGVLNFRVHMENSESNTFRMCRFSGFAVKIKERADGVGNPALQ